MVEIEWVGLHPDPDGREGRRCRELAGCEKGVGVWLVGYGVSEGHAPMGHHK